MGSQEHAQNMRDCYGVDLGTCLDDVRQASTTHELGLKKKCNDSSILNT